MSGTSTNKIVAMLGLAAVVFVGVTWVLPKLEKKSGVVFGHPFAAIPPDHSVATGPVAQDQSLSGLRDFNLSGLAIEQIGTHQYGISGIT
jgi:hypothetical protein